MADPLLNVADFEPGGDPSSAINAQRDDFIGKIADFTAQTVTSNAINLGTVLDADNDPIAYRYHAFKLNGTLTATGTCTLPSRKGTYVLWHNMSGGFDITVNAGGDTFDLRPGEFAHVIVEDTTWHVQKVAGSNFIREALDGLLGSIADGQGIIWDSALGKFVPGSVGGGGSGGSGGAAAAEWISVDRNGIDNAGAPGWDHSVDGDTAFPITFTGLAGAKDIQVLLSGVSASASGSRAMQLSVNNGSSYYGGGTDYQNTIDGVDSGTVALTGTGTDSASARSFQAYIPGADLSGSEKLNTVQSPNDGVRRFVASTDPINALQIINFNNPSANATGGKIWVLVRR